MTKRPDEIPSDSKFEPVQCDEVCACGKLCVGRHLETGNVHSCTECFMDLYEAATGLPHPGRTGDW